MKPFWPDAYQKTLLVLLFCFFLSPSWGINLTDSLTNLLPHQQGAERIETLIQLGEVTQRTDPAQSLQHYLDAYLLSEKAQDSSLGDIAYRLAVSYRKMNKPDSAISYYGKALHAYHQFNDTLSIMKTSTMMGLLLQEKGLFMESASLFKNGIDLFPPYYLHHQGSPDINKGHLATMMTNYGISLHNLGKFDSSLYYHLQSYQIKLEIGASPKLIAKEMVNIGNVYSTMDKNMEAIDFFNQAKEQFVVLQDSFYLRKCFNNIGLAYKRMGDTTEAIANYEQSLKISRAMDFPDGIATSLINLSSLYAGLNETEKSERALNEAFTLSENLQDWQLMSNATQNLASLYFRLKQYDKALTYALKALEMAKKTHEKDLEEVTCELLSQIYEAKGNFKLSLAYHKAYTAIHDSLFNADNTQRFNELQTIFETEKKEQEIALLKQEKANQQLETELLRNRQRYYFALIILILIISAVIAFFVWQKRKKDREIHFQKELYHKKEKELAMAELEKSKIKEEELQQSILYKSKQLSTHALHMMQKNTLMQQIQEDMKTLSGKASAQDKPEFKRINFQINQSLRSDKDWDVFKLYFEEVNRDFYKKLNDLNPELTTNDHRLCALIKLNMNSKEMASVLNVAPNSIKSSRYRLKKKLGLDMEADLEEFIRKL